MAMDGDGRRAEWELKVMEILNECQQRNEPMFVLAMEVAKCVDSAGLGLPSAELGELIVTQLCLPHHNHIRHKVYLWKFLDHALSSSLLSPLQILALLTSRVLPNRMSQPEAYRLYLELVSRYVLSVDWFNSDVCSEKIIKSADVALQLSQNYGVQVLELGHVLALCFFCIMLALIDSTLCDWGLQITTAGDTTSIIKSADNMDVDDDGIQVCRRTDNCEQLRRSNSLKAFEVVGKLSESRKAMVFLRLVYLNMPGKFNALLQRMQFLEACKLSSLNLKSANQVLTNISLNIQKAMRFEYMSNKCQLVRMLIDIKPYKPVPSYNSDSGRFACWVPFDITLENAMDGKQFPVTSTIDVLTETIYTLKEFNDASWQETFLALWLSALRVVQRERDPLEGPVPHLDSRLCILLCITPLAIARVLKDDDKCDTSLQDNIEPGNVVMGDGNIMNDNDHALRKQGLISSLQFLGHYTALLHPPASVVSEANNAVAKAAMFISSSKVLMGETTGVSYHGDSMKEGAGDMRHLIVEACLARNLIDTSAYFWPQYVPTSLTLSSNPSIVQESPWSRFMEGASLTPTLISALMAVPASSLAELEKLYGTALNGLEEEKSAAAKVLCGASLRRGWNIQEHAVQFVVKLLSPPVPPNFNRLRSHLVDYISMLSALLSGASSIDTVHILSLHGVVPEVAASLMPLCENFGSIVPTSSSTADSSSYTVFSSAFLFLLRLWKFYRPPLEHCITGRRGAIGGDLSLEYLLLLCNSRIGSNYSATHDETARNNAIHESTSRKPMLLDFYPKLKAWYCQNKSCTASTLSGLCCGNPVQEVANEILSMILSKMSKSGTLSGDSSVLSGSSCSGPSASNGEDTYQRPLLSAWEVLEAMPFVLEAILTACAHGRLSSRDLTTGLRDLVDYLPASLAAIVSYFAAEITRGTWKAVSMNGIDWPSPAANLQSIESEIREILAAAHVHIPSCLSGVSEATLPLPMAALVSLTITFKLDKSLEYIHAVAGPALENCASGCPWPSMPIISSLWSQKVRRWHDFIVVSASRSVFRQNHEAVSQLLRSCFTSFLGSLNFSSASSLISQHGVNGLLGSFISAPGQYPRVAPGFLYLRSTRGIHHIQNLNQVIVDLVANSAWELASGWSNHIKSQRLSLAGVVDRAKEVGTLGASLLVVGGGQQMVQKLYQETIPTWLLSWKEKNGDSNAVSRLLEGYSMAYLLVLSGALIWGVGSKPPSWSFSRRLHGFQVHMDFIAGVLEGNVSVGCDAATWKAYVCCVVGLVVSHTPMWIQEVKVATLRKLATGLIREWYECDLALSLVEKGGVAAMGAAAELVHQL